MAWKMARVATGSTAEMSDPNAKLSATDSGYTTLACKKNTTPRNV